MRDPHGRIGGEIDTQVVGDLLRGPSLHESLPDSGAELRSPSELLNLRATSESGR